MEGLKDRRRQQREQHRRRRERETAEQRQVRLERQREYDRQRRASTDQTTCVESRHWVGVCMLAFSGSPIDAVSICLVDYVTLH